MCGLVGWLVGRLVGCLVACWLLGGSAVWAVCWYTQQYVFVMLVMLTVC